MRTPGANPQANSSSCAGRVRGAMLGAAAGLLLTAALMPAAAQAPSGSLAERLSAVQSGKANKAQPAPLPAWLPYPAGKPAMAIPLVKDLVVVTAFSSPSGDYESIKSVIEVTPAAVALAYALEGERKPVKNGHFLDSAVHGASNPYEEPRENISGQRVIDVADLRSARGYAFFFANAREHIPGTTAIGTSTQSLDELRAGKDSEFHFLADSISPLLQLGAQINGDHINQPAVSTYAGRAMHACFLHRVEPVDLAVPVLVNDRPVDLPAIHAMCTLQGGDEAHLYYLDQPGNPLTLAYRLGTVDVNLQVIKITLPPPEPARVAAETPLPPVGAAALEQALARREPVRIYGIYFDFNSDRIKPESETTLREIADVMRHNPEWKLSVGGHTDSVGDAAANLALSGRRAAAVKAALVTRYAIAPDRLVTGGYGAAAPVASNQTVEGRARNRRVELQRQ